MVNCYFYYNCYYITVVKQTKQKINKLIKKNKAGLKIEIKQIYVRQSIE